MTRRLIVAALAVALLAPLAPGQLRPGEDEDRGRWEEFLRTADIVAFEQMPELGSVTRPWILTLRSGDVTRKALWKNVDLTTTKEVRDYWRFEIAAYRLDRCLGIGMIPPTVERRFQGKKGSCQLWMDGALPMIQKLKESVDLTPEVLFNWRRGGYLQQAFDDLIGNADRNQGNILLTPDYKWLLIDHSRCFQTSSAFVKQIPFSRATVTTGQVLLAIPRAFLDKVKALDAASIKAATEGYLDGREIKAVLARRALLLAEVEAIVKERGESEVLY